MTAPIDHRSQSDDELRLRLRDDDPSIRLAAAWALGERLGASEIPELRDGEPRERSVGVRQHLLAVLAGMQEMDPIHAVAGADPDARLRATAAGFLARRVADDRGAVESVGFRFAHETDASVLIAMVQALPASAPPLIEAGCDLLLGRKDTDLRLAILERRIEQGGPLLALELLDRMVKDGADVRGRVLDAWIARVGPTTAIRAVAGAPVAIVADALARIDPGTIAWSELAPIAARNLAAMDALLLPHATHASDLACRSFLVALIARAIDPASRVHADTARFRSDLVQGAIASLERALHALPIGSDPALEILLEISERALAGADPDALEADQHWLASIIGEVRFRLGAPGPHGWLGALWHVRDPRPRTVIDHTGPDGTSSILFAPSAGLELRASLHRVQEIADAVPDPAAGEILRALLGGAPLDLDPDLLDRALSRTIPPYAALAEDIRQIARIAAARSSRVRLELVEGWWDRERAPVDRQTLLDASEPPRKTR